MKGGGGESGGESHGDGGTLEAGGGQEGAGVKAGQGGDPVFGDGFEAGIEGGGDGIEIAPGEGDALLSEGELALQGKEGIVGLEGGEIFEEGVEAGLEGGGVGAGLAGSGGRGLSAEGGDGFLRGALVGDGGREHRDEVGDEVMAAFEFDVDERPGAVDPLAEVDEGIVGGPEPAQGANEEKTDRGGDQAEDQERGIANPVLQGLEGGDDEASGPEEKAGEMEGNFEAAEAAADLVLRAGGNEEEGSGGVAGDFRGDDILAFARLADDVEGVVEGNAGLGEAALVGGMGDGGGGCVGEVKGVGSAAGAGEEGFLLDFSAFGADEDGAVGILKVKGRRSAPGSDGGPPGFRAGAGAGFAVGIAVGFGDGAGPVFLRLPGIANAEAGGEEAGEGRFGLGGALEFDEADKDAGGGGGGEVFDEAAPAGGTESKTEAKQAEEGTEAQEPEKGRVHGGHFPDPEEGGKRAFGEESKASFGRLPAGFAPGRQGKRNLG